MSNSEVARSLRDVLSSGMQSMWTWSGMYFGYRRNDSLFTYDGVEVGQFVGTEIYGIDGSYLGELRRTEVGGDRLIKSSYKKSRTAAGFVPTTNRPHQSATNRIAQPLYCGYEEFPPPEALKRMVMDRRKMLSNEARLRARRGARSKQL